jgi:ribonuclease HII
MRIIESNRLKNLCEFEDSLFIQGYNLIAGVDEAGRGSLAGPLVAAAVILNRKKMFIDGINDSKKISPGKRKELYSKIIDSCLSYFIVKIPSKKIDEISLGKANMLAFEKAISGLDIKPQIVLSDAFDIKNSTSPVLPIVKGDELSISIASASIIAKVARDRIMEEFDTVYPVYGFRDNKGYGTGDHFMRLKKYGPCPIHRLSFRGVSNEK